MKRIIRNNANKLYVCILLLTMTLIPVIKGNSDNGCMQNTNIPANIYGVSPQTLKKNNLYAWKAKAEDAVQNGLRWLVSQQNIDGSWGTTDQMLTTCFALETYLRHGEFPESKEFENTINKAIAYLMYANKTKLSSFECAKIAYIMNEIYAMSKNSSAREIAENKIRSLIASQNEAGGWGKQLIATRENNTIIDCWVAYAFKSYKMAGLTNNKFDDSWVMAVQGIQTNSNMETGEFGVFNSDDTSLFATSAGIRGLYILGATKTQEYKMGLDSIVKANSFSWEDYTSFPLDESLFKYYFLREPMFEFAFFRDIDSKRIWWDWYSNIQKTLSLKQTIIMDKDKRFGYWTLDNNKETDLNTLKITIMSILLLEHYNIMSVPRELLYEYPQKEEDYEIKVEIDI